MFCLFGMKNFGPKRAQFERVRFSLVIRVNFDKAAPGLKPRLEVVRDTGISQIVGGIVTLRIVDVAQIAESGQVFRDGMKGEYSGAVLVCDRIVLPVQDLAT